MSLVVIESRKCLATGAKVSVMTDSTLVSIALDRILSTRAKGSITINTEVFYRCICPRCNGFVERCKTMTWVDLWCREGTDIAEIPIRAIQAFVTYTDNSL